MDLTLKAFLTSWEWRPGVALVVAGLGVAYIMGWRRLRVRKRGAVKSWDVVLYLTGLAVIVLALFSPLDTFEASLRNEFVHNLQHLSFFAAALVYWWPLINPAPRLHGHIPYGFRLVYVFAAVGPVMLPAMSIAFFARGVLYPSYTTVPRLWGLSALEDQTSGWVLMGVLDGMIYAVAFLLLVAAMLNREERMTRLREAIDVGTTRSRHDKNPRKDVRRRDDIPLMKGHMEH